MPATNLPNPQPPLLDISQAISRIYHFTQGETATDFSQNALTQLAQLIDIDSACWLVLTSHQPMSVVEGFEYPIANAFLDDFSPLITTELLHQLQLRCGSSIVWQSKNENNHYNKYLQQRDIHQQMLSLHQHENTRHLLVLNRKSKTATFTEEQSALLHFIVPSLINAFHQSLQAKLARHWRYWRSHRAICDQRGNIVEAQDDFLKTLEQNLFDWDKRSLPDAFDSQSLPLKFKYGEIKIEIVKSEALYMAEAYQFDSHIESLTPAELNIAELLLKAHTLKEMAKIQGLSEKTIDNQMQQIFNKLNVSSSPEAIMILKNSDYRFCDKR